MDVLEVRLTDPSARARYDALFEACPAAFIQQSTYWAEAVAPLGPDTPLFLLYAEGGEDVAGLPLYLYEHRLGNVLTSVPQAGPLGGVFVRDGLEPATRERAYAALLGSAAEIAGQHACLALTIITNPFAPDRDLYERHLAPTLEFENFTQAITLDQVVVAGQIVLRDYLRRSNLSRNLNRARSAGFTVRTSTAEADLHRWYGVHAQRHGELGATPLPFVLLRNLLAALGPRQKAHLVLVEDGSRVASGCLYVYHRSVLDVFILSMDSAYADQAPNFLNTEASLVWAAAAGVQIYNWQSAPSRNSGVYRYKAQWGSQESPYYFVTKLLAPAADIMALGEATLKAEYPGHYVVPFGVFADGLTTRQFRKG